MKKIKKKIKKKITEDCHFTDVYCMDMFSKCYDACQIVCEASHSFVSNNIGYD